MGIVDKMKEFMGVPAEEMDGAADQTDISEEELPKREMRNPSAFDDKAENRRNNKVVNIHATTQLQVVLVKPERFDRRECDCGPFKR